MDSPDGNRQRHAHRRTAGGTPGRKSPDRSNAPPEAVPNLLERITAQGAENEINLANFFETLAGPNQACNQPCD